MVADVLGDGGLADLPEDDEIVLAAGGGGIGDQVGDGVPGGLEGRGGGGDAGLGGLDLVGEDLGAVEQGLLLVAGRFGDLLAQALLLGAETLEGLEGTAVVGVGGQQRVDGLGGGAPLLLAGAEQVRILSQCTQIDHHHRLPA
ncbi:hypothetical protein GCM10029992_10100 [Glycomyces albus]